MIRKFLFALALGTVGAAMVHIAVLLLVPTFSERDAWSRLARTGGLFTFTPIADDEPMTRGASPFLRTIACRFTIDAGMTRIRARGDIPFWTAAIFDRSGQNIYSLNDRTSVAGELDIVVTGPLQIMELRNEMRETFQDAVFVGLETEEGIAVIRAAVPDESWERQVQQFLDSAECIQE